MYGRVCRTDVPRHEEAVDARSSIEKYSGVTLTESRAGLTAGLVVAVLAALLLVTGLIIVAVCIRRRRLQHAATSTGQLATELKPNSQIPLR